MSKQDSFDQMVRAMLSGAFLQAQRELLEKALRTEQAGGFTPPTQPAQFSRFDLPVSPPPLPPIHEQVSDCSSCGGVDGCCDNCPCESDGMMTPDELEAEELFNYINTMLIALIDSFHGAHGYPAGIWAGHEACAMAASNALLSEAPLQYRRMVAEMLAHRIIDCMSVERPERMPDDVIMGLCALLLDYADYKESCCADKSDSEINCVTCSQNRFPEIDHYLAWYHANK